MSIEKKVTLKEQIFKEKEKYLTMCIPSKAHIIAAYFLDTLILASVFTVLVCLNLIQMIFISMVV